MKDGGLVSMGRYDIVAAGEAPRRHGGSQGALTIGLAGNVTIETFTDRRGLALGAESPPCGGQSFGHEACVLC